MSDHHGANLARDDRGPPGDPLTTLQIWVQWRRSTRVHCFQDMAYVTFHIRGFLGYLGQLRGPAFPRSDRLEKRLYLERVTSASRGMTSMKGTLKLNGLFFVLSICTVIYTALCSSKPNQRSVSPTSPFPTVVCLSAPSPAAEIEINKSIISIYFLVLFSISQKPPKVRSQPSTARSVAYALCQGTATRRIWRGNLFPKFSRKL